MMLTLVRKTFQEKKKNQKNQKNQKNLLQPNPTDETKSETLKRHKEESRLLKIQITALKARRFDHKKKKKEEGREEGEEGQQKK